MVSAIIVDDEVNSAMLRNILRERCPSVVMEGIASEVSSAHALIQELDPDLVFLDIVAFRHRGFDIPERLRPLPFEVIFLAASTEHVLEVFKYDAVDYLLKPLLEEDIVHAVQRAEARIADKHVGRGLAVALPGAKPVDSLQKIGLPVREGLVFIDAREIIRCEASGAYSIIYYGQGQKLMLSRNLAQLEALLQEGIFFRVHHSFIINLHKVSRYFRGKGGEVEMEDGSLVPVSAQRKKYFLQRYTLHSQQ